MMDVVKFSQKTKQEAEELLKYGNVLDVLAKYGEVSVTGSYKYDLMWGPDIDLVVITDNPEDASRTALKDFVEQEKFQKYQLGDFINFPREGRPQGMIVTLIHEFEGRRWEIEIWFAQKLFRGDVDQELESLLTNASEKQKETILTLKHQREIHTMSKHRLDSPTIYRGALKEGKVKVEDF